MVYLSLLCTFTILQISHPLLTYLMYMYVYVFFHVFFQFLLSPAEDVDDTFRHSPVLNSGLPCTKQSCLQFGHLELIFNQFSIHPFEQNRCSHGKITIFSFTSKSAKQIEQESPPTVSESHNIRSLPANKHLSPPIHMFMLPWSFTTNVSFRDALLLLLEDVFPTRRH